MGAWATISNSGSSESSESEWVTRTCGRWVLARAGAGENTMGSGFPSSCREQEGAGPGGAGTRRDSQAPLAAKPPTSAAPRVGVLWGGDGGRLNKPRSSCPWVRASELGGGAPELHGRAWGGSAACAPGRCRRNAAKSSACNRGLGASSLGEGGEVGRDMGRLGLDGLQSHSLSSPAEAGRRNKQTCINTDTHAGLTRRTHKSRTIRGRRGGEAADGAWAAASTG